ncbi:hypothetical protein, partial [Paraburkholderia caledonica]|uniref:hypothetical protein n=1 Tax=Paraburkholderia caledonica TaxID=134536 RepID=UPI0038BCD3AA
MPHPVQELYNFLQQFYILCCITRHPYSEPATNYELSYIPASSSGHIACGHLNAATARVAFARPAYKTRKARPAIMVGMSAAPSSFIG